MQPVATTANGILHGREADDGVRRWLGIPYAVATRGARPQPAPGWTGPRDATRFGAACPQPGFGDLVPGGALGAEANEVCQFLNVWVPPGAGPWPVLVWIHGGSFLTGAASQAMYDGAALARRGAIVVSINYRVGPFGFLAATPQLASRGWTANCGLHDVVIALQWVRANIAGFGGDDHNVTVFGESAGGGVIVHLLGAPGRAELFDRAIMQSASAGRTFDTATGELVAERFVEVVGGVDALYDAPADRLLDGIGGLFGDPAVFGAVGMMPFHPANDGELVHDAPSRSVTTGAHAGCDLVVSVTRDEMNLFLETSSMTPEKLTKRVARYATIDAAQADRLIDRYRALLGAEGLPHDPIHVWGAIYSDHEMTLPTRAYIDAAAQHHGRVFAAYFDWAAPARADGRPVGASHAMDLPFTFSSLDVDGWRAFVGAGGARATAGDRLAGAMGAAWVAFARDGDPGWPRWSEGHTMLELGEHIGPCVDSIGRRAALWDGIA